MFWLAWVVVWLWAGVSPAQTLSYQKLKEAYHRSYEFEREGQYAKSIQALMPVYQKYPRGYTINLRLGWLFYLSGRYRNAIEHYEKAAAAAPGSVEALLGLSLPYLAQKNWSKVETLMYRVLKIDFYNYYGNLRLAQALRNQKKYYQAEAVCRKMLALYPTDVNFLAELALNLYYRNQKSEAKKLFRDLSILAPQNPLPQKFLSEPKNLR